MTDAEFGIPGIFTNVRDGLVLVRMPDLEIVLFNPAASELTGVPEGKALKQRLDQVFPAADVIETVRECAAQPVGAWPGHDQVALPTRRPGRDGSDPLEIHFCRIEDVGVGGPLVLLVLRPAAEAGLGTAIRQGQQARRRVGELETDVGRLESDAKQMALHLSEATHEFNTPLTVIALQAELLRHAIGDQAPSQERALKIIHANVHRLVLLAQDLTDLSRAETGRLLASAAELDMAQLTKGEVANFQALAAESGVTLAFKGPAAPVPISGDPARLRQVLGNFISNALKFTPPKGRVTVTVTEADGGARIEVKDTGPGMDAKDMARLFQPFVRITTPGQPKKPGTGLGLHLCKRIVEAHGGEVGCHSEGCGKGMMFWFTVPPSTPSTDTSNEARAEPPRREGRRPASSKRTRHDAKPGRQGRRRPEADMPASRHPRA